MEPEVGYTKQRNNHILSHYNMRFVIEKIKKDHLRSLWISRINAAGREMGVPYSKIMNSMSDKNIILNRKILAELAVETIQLSKRLFKPRLTNHLVS